MYFGELRSTFFRSTNFRQRMSCTLLVVAQRNLAWLGVWPMDTYSPNLVNFGLLFQGTQIFHGGYLAHFSSERDQIWQHYGNWCVTYLEPFQ